MMKILIFFVFISSLSYSQNLIGFRYGRNYSNIAGNKLPSNVKLNQSAFRTGLKGGNLFGISFVKIIKNKFILGCELQYNQLGYYSIENFIWNDHGLGYRTRPALFEYYYNYLSLQLSAGYKFNIKSNFLTVSYFILPSFLIKRFFSDASYIEPYIGSRYIINELGDTYPINLNNPKLFNLMNGVSIAFNLKLNKHFFLCPSTQYFFSLEKGRFANRAINFSIQLKYCLKN